LPLVLARPLGARSMPVSASRRRLPDNRSF
jgi:hypothetical protein